MNIRQVIVLKSIRKLEVGELYNAMIMGVNKYSFLDFIFVINFNMGTIIWKL